MSDSLATRQSLLVQIRDLDNNAAWAQFVDAYAPLVYRYVRRQGLQDADAADLTQDVLRSIVRAAGEFVYDPSKGRFRTWLYTVTRNKVINHWAARKHAAVGTGDTQSWNDLAAPIDPENDSAEWDRDYQRRVFDWACERVRPGFRDASWQAFWLTGVENKPAAEVASTLGISVGAVYIAKSRVLAAMKEAIKELAGDEEL
jgi:RNA polymerase sigma-70 factor (ECF subfamily)